MICKDNFEYCHQTLEYGQKPIKRTEKFISKRNIIYVDSKDILREELPVKLTRSVNTAKSIGRKI